MQDHPSPGVTADTCADRRIEQWIVNSGLPAHSDLPPVEELAQRVGFVPNEVCRALPMLLRAGSLTRTADGRIRVSPLVASGPRSAPRPARRVRDLSSGNPDPALLVPVRPRSAGEGSEHLLYGEPRIIDEMRSAAALHLGGHGLHPDPLILLPGGLEAVERILATLLMPGDTVIVEEPTYNGDLLLLSALGLRPVPVPVDDAGFDPEHLAAALPGANACLVRPRAQNLTGAALTPERASHLRQLVADHGRLLVVEEDHAGPVAGAAYQSIVPAGHARWLHVASVSKWLAPDMRFAMVIGDPTSVRRVGQRQLLGGGWVSRSLQAGVANALHNPELGVVLAHARSEYTNRREALISLLRGHGLIAHGRSGLNVWIPVRDEQAATARLMPASPYARSRREAREQMPTRNGSSSPSATSSPTACSSSTNDIYA